jgi:hypothetical protein
VISPELARFSLQSLQYLSNQEYLPVPYIVYHHVSLPCHNEDVVAWFHVCWSALLVLGGTVFV